MLCIMNKESDIEMYNMENKSIILLITWYISSFFNAVSFFCRTVYTHMCPSHALYLFKSYNIKPMADSC